MIDDVMVHRVTVDVRSRVSKASASVRFAARLVEAGRSCDIIHLHGVSQKNVPAAIFARALGKPQVLTMHTAGQDEPQVVQRRGRLAYWAFTSADLVLSVSPYMTARYCEAHPEGRRLPPTPKLTPNGVDTNRFRPADRGQRLSLRRQLGWPDSQPTVLFVGFFSRDKRPDLLFRAWKRLPIRAGRVRLVFVGATRGGYHEIDEALASQIQAEAAELGRADDITFVDPTNNIETYYRAADVFVLPSIRESQSLALIEAMASGLPSIATQLPGVTEILIEDGTNGRLIPPDDEWALADAINDLLMDQPAAWLMGARARETVTTRYDIKRTAEGWLAAYEAVRASRR
jgi:glycosyltransferase involved in cell wall biosynthesis